jgi:hypothetical protein
MLKRTFDGLNDGQLASPWAAASLAASLFVSRFPDAKIDWL